MNNAVYAIGSFLLLTLCGSLAGNRQFVIYEATKRFTRRDCPSVTMFSEVFQSGTQRRCSCWISVRCLWR
jgi:hypothetical protein